MDSHVQAARSDALRRQFRHPERAGTVTVAGRLGDDVPKGTLASIWRQAGRSEGKSVTEYVVVIEQEGNA